MAGPVVAFLGATGNIGRPQIPAFLDALKEGRIKELRLLVSEGKIKDELVRSWEGKGAKIVAINYSNVPSLASALSGVNVAVSTIKGPEHDMVSTWDNLLEAIVSASVKIYFPSEFDACLDSSPAKEWSHPWWDYKRKHFQEAKAKGVKPIRMATGPIPDFVFSPFLGCNPAESKWDLFGNANAADQYVSVISNEDIGMYTCEAVIYAHKNPETCPEEFKVYSETKTLREYAALFDKFAGKTTTFETTPLEVVKAQYELIPDPMIKFVTLVRIMLGIGGCDNRESAANELLNPGQSKWKLMKFEDYAATFMEKLGTTLYQKQYQQMIQSMQGNSTQG